MDSSAKHSRNNGVARSRDFKRPAYGAWLALMSVITLGLSAALFNRFRPGGSQPFGPLRTVYLYDMLLSLAALLFSLWFFIPRLWRRVHVTLLTLITIGFIAAFGWTQHQRYYNAPHFGSLKLATTLVVFLGLTALTSFLYWFVDLTLYFWGHRHRGDNGYGHSKYSSNTGKYGAPMTAHPGVPATTNAV